MYIWVYNGMHMLLKQIAIYFEFSYLLIVYVIHDYDMSAPMAERSEA